MVGIVMMASWHAMAAAEVVAAGPGGFTTKYSADIALPPPSVWAALSDVGRWWDAEHTFSGDAHNLELQPVIHGCLCEKLGLYGAVEHMRVVYAQPPKVLRLVGALGPLQEFGISGSMTWRIEPTPGGSRIAMSYNVGGYTDRPLDQWAPLVDEMLTSQVQRFARFAASGNPEQVQVKPDAPTPKR
jgi:hypothetical protein